MIRVLYSFSLYQFWWNKDDDIGKASIYKYSGMLYLRNGAR